jgi:hypothetical protein
MSALPRYFRHVLRYCQGVINFDAEVSDSALDLGIHGDRPSCLTIFCSFLSAPPATLIRC